MKEPRFIRYSKMYPKEYLKYVKSMNSGEAKLTTYTRNQMQFAMHLLKKRKEIAIIGNMEQVFIDVRNYLRLKTKP